MVVEKHYARRLDVCVWVWNRIWLALIHSLSIALSFIDMCLHLHFTFPFTYFIVGSVRTAVRSILPKDATLVRFFLHFCIGISCTDCCQAHQQWRSCCLHRQCHLWMSSIFGRTEHTTFEWQMSLYGFSTTRNWLHFPQYTRCMRCIYELLTNPNGSTEPEHHLGWMEKFSCIKNEYTIEEIRRLVASFLWMSKIFYSRKFKSLRMFVGLC